ncbi:hypothetical protein [Aliagarivorans taiwanensis]|uniref:hypothetical protein n=1 Tax=Aliagarivorans taiwanensis TaxID=561966 RepID=UPI00047E248A|nr:hypothetical protein [Aliagarivorans taiwanensis]
MARSVYIIHHKSQRKLVCEYEGHNFSLDRDPNDGYSFGNWYARVLDESDEVVFEDWIDDSSNVGEYSAMLQTCDCVGLEPPTHWPPHPAKLGSFCHTNNLTA